MGQPKAERLPTVPIIKFKFKFYWNALPTNTKKAQNTNTLKNMLDRWRTYTKLMYDFDE